MLNGLMIGLVTVSLALKTHDHLFMLPPSFIEPVSLLQRMPHYADLCSNTAADATSVKREGRAFSCTAAI
jgi:hypothetical protein